MPTIPNAKNASEAGSGTYVTVKALPESVRPEGIASGVPLEFSISIESREATAGRPLMEPMETVPPEFSKLTEVSEKATLPKSASVDNFSLPLRYCIVGASATHSADVREFDAPDSVTEYALPVVLFVSDNVKLPPL